MKYQRCDGYSDYYDTLPGGNARGRAIEAPLFDANRLGSWKSRLRPSSVPMPIETSEGASMMRLGVTLDGKMTAARVAGRLLRSKLTGQAIYGMGAGLQGRMLEIVLKLGVDIWTDSPLVDFDVEGGKVRGVRLERDGREQTVAAGRGVLVCAGGFSHNITMREMHQRKPILKDWTASNPGDTGEALQAMMALGADTAVMDEAWWNMTFAPPGEERMGVVADLQKPRCILVGEDGRRYVNEANSYMEVGTTSYAKGAVPAWFIADATYRKRYFFGLKPPGGPFKDWIAKGYIKQADTIAELARQCGIDPQALEATVKRFNAFAEAGKDDDFGRGSSVYNRYYADPTNKPNPTLGPIDKAPFWAAPLYPGDVGTCGGVVTDHRARVLKADGSAIEGLYAAGNCAAPLAGAHYVGAGQSIATSSVFGYVAVKEMLH